MKAIAVARAWTVVPALLLPAGIAAGGNGYFSNDGPLGMDKTLRPRVVFAQDLAGRSILVAGILGAGILRTENPEVTTWQPGNHGLAGLDVVTLAASESNRRILYAGTLGGYLHRSEDGGRSWAVRVQRVYLENLVVDPVDPDGLFGVGPYDSDVRGFWRSTDAGRTWYLRSLLPAGSQVLRLILDPTKRSRVFATRFDGVLRSDDEGRTWKNVSAGLPAQAVFNLTMDLQGQTNPVRHLFVDPGSPYESTDGGDTWAPFASPYPQNGSIHPDPGPPAGRAYWLKYEGTFTTTDGGLTWKQAGSRYLGWNLLFDPQDRDRLFAFQATSSAVDSWAGVSRDRGLNFLTATAPTKAMVLLSAAASPRAPSVVYAGGYDTFYRSRNGGVTFDIVGGKGARSIGLTLDGKVVYRTTFTGLYGSTNGGLAWDYLPVPGVDVGSQAFASTVIVDKTDGRKLWVAAAGRLVRSGDSGETWTFSESGLEGAVRALHQVPGEGNGLLAVAGSEPGYRQLFKSADGGDSWVKLARVPEWLDLALAVDPNDPDLVYAGGTSSLWRSTDGGATFGSLLGPPNAVREITVSPADGAIYAVDYWGRLWRGQEPGLRFVPAGLDDARCSSVAATSSGRVYAATGSGLWWIDGTARPGDLDLDGQRDVRDLVVLANLLAGNVYPREAPFLANESAADLDADTHTTVYDLVLMASRIAFGTWPD